MKILVTGARGFVGFSIAEVAARQGWDVWGIGRTSQPPTGWPGGYSWADIAQSDLTPIIEHFAPDVIFHGAGSASVGQSFDAPLDDFRASALTFASLLNSVRRSSCRPVIFFPSSAAIYGNPQVLPVSEETLPAPISPYGFHKLQCELLAREYAECFGLKIIIGRIFSVFGQRQKRLLVWELFRQYVDEQSVVKLQGTGEETRDYLHVEDAASAILQLAVQRTQNPASGLEIFNIASGAETSVLELAHSIGAHLKADKEIQVNTQARNGDPTRWCADVTKLKTAVSHDNMRTNLENLQHTINHWSLEVANGHAPE